MKNLKAILFDLDGTLLDTAPDLAATLNILLARHDHPDIPFEKIRPLVSHGSKALVKFGFKIDEDHPTFASLRNEFLDIYSEHGDAETTFFPGVEKVLQHLTQNDIPWGIVTNKVGWLTWPLLEKFELLKKTDCVVCGDTLPVSKPDPEPLLYACKLLKHSADNCIYIGDAQNDIEAGKRANMRTLIASYGYISHHERPETWGADGNLDNLDELLKWL